MTPQWSSPSGQALGELAVALGKDHPERDFRITVFGSAILQLFHDPSHLSADVDLWVRT
jgi:hypothetical protein